MTFITYFLCSTFMAVVVILFLMIRHKEKQDRIWEEERKEKKRLKKLAKQQAQAHIQTPQLGS